MTLRKGALENILWNGENVGNLFQNKFQILSHIYFVVCKGFEFGPV